MTAAVVADIAPTTTGFEVSIDLSGTPVTKRLTPSVLRDHLETQAWAFDSTVAVTGALTATLATASQPNVTTAAALTTIGTLVAGAVPASLVTTGTFGAGAYTFPGALAITGALSGVTTLAASGLVTASGFGSNLFSAAGTGYNKLTLRNTTAGTGNGAQLSVGMDNDPDNFFIQAYSSTFTPSGFIRAAGAVVQGEGPGGLTVVSSQADFEIWTSPNGNSVTKRLTITGAGAATFASTLAVTGAATLGSTLTFPATAQIIGGSSNGLVIRNSANTADNFAVDDTGAATVRTSLAVSPASGAAFLYVNSVSGSNSQIYLAQASQPTWAIVNAASSGAFFIVENTVSEWLSIAKTSGIVRLFGYTAATWVSGDKYLVVDANGNIHRSAVGPAS